MPSILPDTGLTIDNGDEGISLLGSRNIKIKNNKIRKTTDVAKTPRNCPERINITSNMANRGHPSLAITG
ncbi:MAG: hypothetical protein GWO08_21870 [Gammaproteobacteria bacterium]|nr:hypothetical protein [Gammaproteobacteria bacterium]NIN62916.1 hypothetical protein [Gammaproteobacteria bacterium]NIO63897.1 hypothetical protein [Gammaproteobacteria bacterium]NIP50275.1 hypothetical protein [Gammaproteobacteria bacterium]NIQ12495.1 hypothetical protein [Gammaproteobacteria bacterium]